MSLIDFKITLKSIPSRKFNFAVLGDLFGIIKKKILSIILCMYVVCMHVYMYICMYVCVDVDG